LHHFLNLGFDRFTQKWIILILPIVAELRFDQDVIHYETWRRKHSRMSSLVFGKRLEIASTRKQEQYWLSTTAFIRIKELPLLLVRDRGDLYSTWSLHEYDRNVQIKSSAGSSPSSLVHFKHSQD